MSLVVYACVWARRFATQALVRLRPQLHGTPVAVLEGERPLERVCCLNAHAMRLGATVGMTRAQMETTSVPVHKRSPAEESSARSALLAILHSYTPRVEDQCTGTDCVFVMDLAGTERIFGTPVQIAHAVRDRARAAALQVDIAVSHNFHVALCLAATAFGRILEAPYGYEAQSIHALPLAAIRPDADLAEVFAGWGIRTLGELAALPTSQLTARTGERGQALRQKARGEHPHMFVPIEAAVELRESLAFDEPIELLEPLMFVLNTLLEQLLLRAGAILQALAAVTVTLNLDGGGTHVRSIRPALPTQDRALLLKLLQLDLQANPAPAGVLAIAVQGEPGSASRVQLGLFTPQHPEAMRLEVTLARIAGIVGEGNVGRARLADTHRDDAVTVEKFSVTETKAPRKRTSIGLHQPHSPLSSKIETLTFRDGRGTPASQPGPGRTPPTLRRLRPPVVVPCTAQQPHQLHYENTLYNIRELYGPWRTSGEWWSARVWSEECWDFAASSAESVLMGVLTHDRLRRTWRLEALYD